MGMFSKLFPLALLLAGPLVVMGEDLMLFSKLHGNCVWPRAHHEVSLTVKGGTHFTIYFKDTGTELSFESFKDLHGASNEWATTLSGLPSTGYTAYFNSGKFL